MGIAVIGSYFVKGDVSDARILKGGFSGSAERASRVPA
jgi:hypothetical protein